MGQPSEVCMATVLPFQPSAIDRVDVVNIGI